MLQSSVLERLFSPSLSLPPSCRSLRITSILKLLSITCMLMIPKFITPGRYIQLPSCYTWVSNSHLRFNVCKIKFRIWFSKPDPSAILSRYLLIAVPVLYLLKGKSHTVILGYFLSYSQTETLIASVLKIKKYMESDHFIPLLYHPKPSHHHLSLGLLRSFFIASLFPLLHLVVVVVQSLSRVWLFVTLWTAACQASLSFAVSPAVCSNIWSLF